LFIRRVRRWAGARSRVFLILIFKNLGLSQSEKSDHQQRRRRSNLYYLNVH